MSASLSVMNPDNPKRVLLVASNPAVSKQTGLAHRVLVGRADPPVLGVHGDRVPSRNRQSAALPGPVIRQTEFAVALATSRPATRGRDAAASHARAVWQATREQICQGVYLVVGAHPE